jgi:hypothetical protein
MKEGRDKPVKFGKILPIYELKIFRACIVPESAHRHILTRKREGKNKLKTVALKCTLMH